MKMSKKGPSPQKPVPQSHGGDRHIKGSLQNPASTMGGSHLTKPRGSEKVSIRSDSRTI